MQQPAELITPLMSSDGGDKKALAEKMEDERLRPLFTGGPWGDLYNIYRAEKHPERKEVMRQALSAFYSLQFFCMLLTFAYVGVVVVVTLPAPTPVGNCDYNASCYADTLRDLSEKAAYIANNSRCLEGF